MIPPKKRVGKMDLTVHLASFVVFSPRPSPDELYTKYSVQRCCSHQRQSRSDQGSDGYRCGDVVGAVILDCGRLRDAGVRNALLLTAAQSKYADVSAANQIEMYSAKNGEGN